jgi:transposase
METLFAKVAGLDVHQKTICVAVRLEQPGGKRREQVRTFGTMTSDLLELSDWLTKLEVTHVAMESTGVLWKPVWNVLEGHFQLLLVNPREIKQPPGRKSDVKDCQWIAQLLQCGLLRASNVPARPLRELRDLTRQRAQLVDEENRVANRIHKVLEDANIKLGAVASEVLGVSGRMMLQAMLEGELDPAKLAEFAHGKLRKKIPQLKKALQGHFLDHHRFMLKQLLAQLAHLDGQIAEYCARIEVCLRPFADPATQERLDAIPGVNRRTMENVLAEIGTDMQPFPTAGHLSSWAGLSPAHEESAGKRIRNRTGKGNRWLRRALGEAAWAASHAKDSYFAAQFRRIAARRGNKRALIAVAHSLLVTIYHMLKYHRPYCDLGGDYFNRLNSQHLQRHLVKRLENLGFQVTLQPREGAA